MKLKNIVKTVTIVDVLLAAVLITIYVSLLSDHLEELQLEKRSKRDHVILYIYVCVSILVQLFFAFQFYRVLSLTDDDDEADIEDQLRIAKYWMIAAYLILLNFIIKAGVYAQRCRCTISLTLFVYVVAICFRIGSICIVNKFIKQLEILQAEMIRKEKLETILHHHLHSHHHNHPQVVV